MPDNLSNLVGNSATSPQKNIVAVPPDELQATPVKDIVWLAGFLEGEGSFILVKRKYPCISFSTTDEDVAHKAAGILKKTVYKQKTKQAEHHKDVWRCQLVGQKAAGWMMTLYTLMGARRKKAIHKALVQWKLNDRPWGGAGHYGGK